MIRQASRQISQLHRRLVLLALRTEHCTLHSGGQARPVGQNYGVLDARRSWLAWPGLARWCSFEDVASGGGVDQWCCWLLLHYMLPLNRPLLTIQPVNTSNASSLESCSDFKMLESPSIPLKERDNLKEEGKHSVPLPEFHTLYAYVIEVSGSQEFNAQIGSGSYPSLASVAWPDLVVLSSKFFSKFSESAAADVT